MHAPARWFVLCCALLCAAHTARAIEPPVLHARVTDLAGVLSPSDVSSLEQTLASYEQATSNQFVVLIIPSLEGASIEDFSMRVAEANKMGQKGKDNGVLLLVAIEDRKLRFEIGYGLEGVLTDALTSVIIHDVISPQFKRNNYAQGIADGMKAAMQATTGDFVAPQPTSPRKRSRGNSIGGIILFIIIIVVVSWLRRRGGGGGGGLWFIGFPGGFGGGGGSWGGGDSGGGFGGFDGGGGSFGGGGSSGDW